MKRFIILLIAATIALAIFNGCSRQKTLTIKAFVDGSDVIKVNGDKLWFEHESFKLPERISINGKSWIPQWDANTNATYENLSPAFRPRDPKKIQISKKLGRGDISVVQMPLPENNETLAIRVNDDAPGADWYEFQISW